ncbi:MAG TPA: FG-GAP-like repeat-containing protein, partial [Parapedobacter sp.]|nr:FG-GAP-like repeat-containing protein [Parapedobacter sp.]
MPIFSGFRRKLIDTLFAPTSIATLVTIILLSQFANAASTGVLDYYLRNYDIVRVLEPGDHDGDGIPNEDDAFPFNPNEWLDTDGDLIGNNTDTDDDNDGMPDAYELSYNLNPLVNDGGLDSDSDGVTNILEYQLQTNPVNMLSCSSSACVLDPAPAPASVTFPSLDMVSDSVGTLEGTFSVSKTGNAEYTIPLYVPEGTAGVTPKLAVKYRSDSGNGLLGKDWSIGALSVITRCGQTRSQEGQARAVTYSPTDRFCLDGKKLILVNPSDTYGGDGVEYRTETDDFKKIVSYTLDLNTGPNNFRVWHKDGSVSTYGGGYATVVALYPSRIIMWGQSRIENANSYSTAANNPVVYNYFPFNPYENPNSELRIKSIEYAFANSTDKPNVVIEFEYSLRPDIKYTYIPGRGYSHDQRLYRIVVRTKTSTGMAPIRQYSFNYINSSSAQNRTSKLKSIRVCGLGPCYPATQLTWSDAIAGSGSKDTIIDFGVTEGASVPGLTGFLFDPPEEQELQRYIPVDYNGDGKSDLIWLQSDGNNFKFVGSPSNGSTFSSSTTQSAASHSISAWTTSDFDQDGYPDILFVSDAALYVYRNQLINGERSYNTAAIQLIGNLDMGTEPELDGSWSDPKGIFADFNADGLMDVYYNKAIYLMEKDGSQTNGPYKFGAPKIITLGDPDVPGTLNNEIKSANNNIAYQTVDLDSAQVARDFDGDGLPDFVAKVWLWNSSPGTEPWAGPHVILLNDGDGGLAYLTTAFTSLQSGPNADRSFYISDLNNDGRSDMVYSSYSQQFWEYGISTGAALGTFDAVHIVRNNISSPDPIVPIGLYDINQDDLPDFVYRVIKPGNDKIMVDFNNGYAPIEGWGSKTLVNNIASENLGNILFMDIDGDSILDYVDLEEKVWPGNKASGTSYNRIVKITNGLGEETDITYAPLTDPMVYTREFDAPTVDMGAPLLDLYVPALVVSSVSISAPVEGDDSHQRSMSYKYGGLKVQPAGRGFLGFRTMQTTDNETGISILNEFRQDFPFIGMLAYTQTMVSGQSIPLEETTYAYDTLPHISGVYLPVFVQSVNTQRIAESDPASSSPALTMNGVLSTTTITASNYDAYGNAGTVVTIIAGDGAMHTTTTTNTWANDVTNWRLGQLTNVVESKQQGSSTRTRTTSYTYNAQSGLLESMVREPQAGNAIKLTTSYEYDAFGNINKTTMTSATSGARYERFVYDATGRYVDKVYNSLGQLVSNVTQRNSVGQLEIINGLNGKVEYRGYSKLGRQTFSATNEGLSATTQYKLCTEVACPSSAVYRAQTTATDGSLSNVYADTLGREIRKESKSFDGGLSITDTWYDAAGRVKRQSAPYLSGDAVHWNTNHYDNLGRVIKVVDASGGTSLNHFSRYTNGSIIGIKQLSKNQLNQSKTSITNGKGQVIKVVDNLNGYINYAYNATGNLNQVDTNGVITIINYDVLGRRTKLDDPDQGLWLYQYNPFGDMTQQLDAAGSKTTMAYNALGLMKRRKDFRADQTLESDAQWTYGTSAAANNVGLLAMEEDLVGGYIKVYAYDGHGRLSQTITSLGQNGQDGDYAEYFTYDQYGRPFQRIDSTAHGVQYVYNASGYQQQLVEATDTAHVYRTVNQADAWGNITSESLVDTQFQVARTYSAKTGLPTSILASSTYGVARTLLDIDLTFDLVGNLISRTRSVQASGALPAKTLAETFGYDALNRLTSIAATGHATQTQTYDIAGNILNKTGVGSYTYGAGNAGPHAVTAAGSATYSYDVVGNMTSGD